MQAAPPTQLNGRSPIAILGVPFDNVTTAEALTLIGDLMRSGQPHYAAVVNVDFLVQAMEDVELRRILFDAHLVLAGEAPVVWAAKMLGNPLPECITGTVLVPQLLALAEQKGWRVFLLGGTEQSAAAAAEKARSLLPRLQLVGTHSPPAKPLLEMAHADILHRLREAKPDLLLVAFGCPKEEKWINMNYREAGVPFMLGVGSTIDFLTGAAKTPTDPAEEKPRPPARKLWTFALAILRQWRQLRGRKSVPPTEAANVIPDPFGNLIIRAPERLGVTEVQASRDEWLRAVENSHVMFDLTDTVFTDSTGIGALIRLRKRARELDHQFFLVAPRPPVLAALRLMKLDEFFTVQASLAGVRMVMESAAAAPAVTSDMLKLELQIRWAGEVTALNAVELGAYTESELTQASPGGQVVIDLSRVTFVDSTGIGLMLRFKKNLKRRDITLQFTNPIASVRNVLRHTRLEEYLLTAG